MFSETAPLYDLIYASFKNYSKEVESINALLRRLHPNAQSVIDVGCGSGEHARLLTDFGYTVDGIDLDPGFVDIAARKNPAGRFQLANMADFDLGRTYDVVLCLFSSIAYVRTFDAVVRTLENFHRHLAPGGVTVVEPWFQPGELQSGYIAVQSADAPDLKVCRMSHTHIEGRLSRIQFEYMIGNQHGIRRAAETHELGLFTTQEMKEAFAAAGFAPEYDSEGLTGRGLFTARKAGNALG